MFSSQNLDSTSFSNHEAIIPPQTTNKITTTDCKRLRIQLSSLQLQYNILHNIIMCRRWSLRRWSSKASASKRALLLDSVFVDMSNDVLSPVAASPTATTPSKKKNNKSPYDFDEYAAAGGSGFSIQLTVKFIVATIFLTASIAFTAGCIARNILLSPPPSTMLSRNYQDDIAVALHPVDDDTVMKQLPTPTILDGKEVPPTLYTSKNFDERGHTVHLERTTTSSEDDEICSSEKEEEENQLSNTSGYDDSVVEEDVEYSHDGLLYVPAGESFMHISCTTSYVVSYMHVLCI